MARRGNPTKRKVIPDPIYKNVVVTRLINKILWKGKKSVAEGIMYGSLKILGDKTKENPIDILEKCLDNVRPYLEVKSRRVGGANYQVPIEVTPTRANTLALRWIIGFARKRREKTMAERLAGEILRRRKQYRQQCKKEGRFTQNGRSQ